MILWIDQEKQIDELRDAINAKHDSREAMANFWRFAVGVALLGGLSIFMAVAFGGKF